MSTDFGDQEDLLERLTVRPDNLVYLVGSPISSPGVPSVQAMIELVRAELSESARQRLDARLKANPRNEYQTAFLFLQQNRGQNAVNRIVQQAVLQARRGSTAYPTVPSQVDDIDHCRALEGDLEGWNLAPAVEALGRILVDPSAGTRPVVLTPNFDPLIKVSVRRAGGPFHSVALHGDGSLPGVDGLGCLIVQFHGDWYRTDTLHTPAQLGRERRMLSASLAKLIHTHTLVVLAYSGWDDIFKQALISAIVSGLAEFDVLWTFFNNDESRIIHDSAALLESLKPGIDLGRIVPYKGIDAHTLLPRLADRLGATRNPGIPAAPRAAGPANDTTSPTLSAAPRPTRSSEPTTTRSARPLRVGDRVRSKLGSETHAGGLVTKLYPDLPGLAQVQYSGRPPTDYMTESLELDDRLQAPLQPNIDVPKLAGRPRGQVEQLLGPAVRHERVNPSGMGPALKCWYRAGWVEVVYKNNLSDWITIHGLGDIPFTPSSLALFGFPRTRPTFRNDHVIRWHNLGDIVEINLFAGQNAMSHYLYIKTSTP